MALGRGSSPAIRPIVTAAPPRHKGYKSFFIHSWHSITRPTARNLPRFTCQRWSGPPTLAMTASRDASHTFGLKLLDGLGEVGDGGTGHGKGLGLNAGDWCIMHAHDQGNPVPRKRQSMLDDLFAWLKTTPVWVGPLLAAFAFALFRFILPVFRPEGQVGFWPPVRRMISWIIPIAILGAWVMAEVWKLTNRRLLDGQTGVESIRKMSWREFERLVSEAYRRRGFVVEVVGGASGDGGVDIRLTRRGEKVLVQCKQWKAWKVGVQIVRQLLGVVVSEKATKGIVVTSGRFTKEAVAFARSNPQIELVDGEELVELIREVQHSSPTPSVEPARPAAVATESIQTPSCPLCGSQMVLRAARKGRNAGSQFWGCPKYPACRGTKPA